MVFYQICDCIYMRFVPEICLSIDLYPDTSCITWDFFLLHPTTTLFHLRVFAVHIASQCMILTTSGTDIEIWRTSELQDNGLPKRARV